MIFFALWNGFDVQAKLEQAKRLLWGGSADSDEKVEVPQVQTATHPSNNSDTQTKVTAFLSTLAVAFALNKILVPFKVMFTAFATPYVARWFGRRPR
jgi:hypothetical protein